MNILFITRATLYESPGGDTVQIIKTAEALRRLGIQVTIGLTNQKFIYKDYDLIHYFNIIRPADILFHFKRSRINVISSIFVDYLEADKKSEKIFRSILAKTFSSFTIEYLKTITKAILRKEKVQDTSYFWLGQYKSMLYLYQKANAILPNSISELQRLEQAFGKTNAICKKIVNAIEINDTISANEDYKNAVICVGRIENRKNQLRLIKAMNELKLPCFIIGNPAINDISYFEECKKEALSHIQFISNLPQNEIYAIMKAAKVHVLPSWFETTGLVSLEAAYYGCSIVISEKGDQKEYFGTNAFYCDPNDILSIKEAILKAYEAPFNESFKNYISKHYHWDRTAQETLDIYLNLLK